MTDCDGESGAGATFAAKFITQGPMSPCLNRQNLDASSFLEQGSPWVRLFGTGCSAVPDCWEAGMGERADSRGDLGRCSELGGVPSEPWPAMILEGPVQPLHWTYLCCRLSGQGGVWGLWKRRTKPLLGAPS